MTASLKLTDGIARAEVHPAVGAAIGLYDVTLRGERTPIFQVEPSSGRSGPFALGCNILMPFSNRISGGGFCHDGQFHTLDPALPDAPLPIHGNALISHWTVARRRTDSVLLELVSDGPGPFRYVGAVSYRLRDGALHVALSLRNSGKVSLPFGIGLHPWFVRSPQMRIRLAARGYWTETKAHLPDAYHAIAAGSAQDLSHGGALPEGWINRAYTGWNGHARIDWLEHGVGVDIAATPPLTTAILYSPSAVADFVCLEPVSHSVDAHNDIRPGSSSPQVLAPDETFGATVIFTPAERKAGNLGGA